MPDVKSIPYLNIIYITFFTEVPRIAISFPPDRAPHRAINTPRHLVVATQEPQQQHQQRHQHNIHINIQRSATLLLFRSSPLIAPLNNWINIKVTTEPPRGHPLYPSRSQYHTTGIPPQPRWKGLYRYIALYPQPTQRCLPTGTRNITRNAPTNTETWLRRTWSSQPLQEQQLNLNKRGKQPDAELRKIKRQIKKRETKLQKTRAAKTEQQSQKNSRSKWDP